MSLIFVLSFGAFWITLSATMRILYRPIHVVDFIELIIGVALLVLEIYLMVLSIKNNRGDHVSHNN